MKFRGFFLIIFQMVSFSCFATDELIRVGFDQTEMNLIQLIKNDAPKMQAISPRIIIYSVDASGSRNSILRSRIESLISETQITLVNCPECDLLFSYDSETNLTLNHDELKKVGSEKKVSHGLYVQEAYSTRELVITVKMIEFSSGDIKWMRTYSSKELFSGEFKNQTKDPSSEYNRVLLGEIAFRTVLSTGFISLPRLTLSEGAKSQESSIRPFLGVLIGERYDGGKKEFGFGFGSSFKISTEQNNITGSSSLEIPPLFHIGPQFRYIFNPQNNHSAKWIFQGELGSLFANNLSTGFIGFGPEIMMIQRFSVGLELMFISETEFKSPTVGLERFINDQSTEKSPTAKFGGAATLFRANILW